MESYNSKTIIIKNATTRNVNISLRFDGVFSDEKIYPVFWKDEIYEPGKTTETISLSYRTGKENYPYKIRRIRLSGPDCDNTSEKQKSKSKMTEKEKEEKVRKIMEQLEKVF